MTVSIKDIAKAAGVSHSTVSRALSNSPLVNPETAERIRRIAQEMGYSPSAIARSLVTKRTYTIGLVVTSIADPFVAEIVRGTEEVALDNGYHVFLCNSNADPDREMAVVTALRERRVDGIIVTASRVGDLYLPLLEESQVPIVLINNQREGEYVYSIATDNVHGGQLATHYFIELGHRRIGCLTGPEGASSSFDRLEGYKRTLRQHNIPFDPALIGQGDGAVDGGERAMGQLLSLSSPPTAVFCYNDRTAIGALAAIKSHGLQVPQDISLVGFDDIAFAAYVAPPLTTIAQQKYEMGRLAMEMVLRLLDGEGEVKDIVLLGKLVIRESCQRFPGTGS
jgi:LacI family repressor for deo operon, udp, cdd, tsx, nupC, and nupG